MHLRLIHLLICLLFIQHLSAGCPSKAADNDSGYESLIEPGDDRKTVRLSARGLALAKALGILGEIEKLARQEEANRASFSDKRSYEILRTRQQLADLIQYATLQVKEVTAAIDIDMAETNRLLDFLTTRRDNAVRVNNIATFMTSGALSALNSALNLAGSGGGATNVLGTVSGGASVGMPTYNIYSKRTRGRMSYRVHPNMLAPIFGFPATEGAEYNSIIWSYLNSSPPGSTAKMTRREKLIASWMRLRGLPDPSTNSGKKRAAILSGVPVPNSNLTVSILDERSAMLTDVRAEVVNIFRDLSELKAGIMAI